MTAFDSGSFAAPDALFGFRFYGPEFCRNKVAPRKFVFGLLHEYSVNGAKRSVGTHLKTMATCPFSQNRYTSRGCVPRPISIFATLCFICSSHNSCAIVLAAPLGRAASRVGCSESESGGFPLVLAVLARVSDVGRKIPKRFAISQIWKQPN